MKKLCNGLTGIGGYIAPGFELCADAFCENFQQGGELGAACAIYRGDELVVDMWGGVACRSESKPWSRDTIVPVFSVTKGVGTICILRLVQADLLELDRPIAEYWPEFAAYGKSRVTVREGLAHLAGVPVVDGDISIADIQDTRGFASRVAGQPPIFKPRTSPQYHAITIGWMTSELVWRITGRSVGEYFRESIAEQLGLDCWIGIPRSAQQRVAEVEAGDYDPETEHELTNGSVPWRALTLNGLFPKKLIGDGTGLNDPRVQRVELAGAGGISDARSLARLYAAVIGKVDNAERLVSPELLADACNPVSKFSVGKVEGAWATGFLLPFEWQPMLGPASFGHDGAGKNLAFADRNHEIAFAYVRNRMNLKNGRDGLIYAVIDALRMVIGQD